MPKTPATKKVTTGLPKIVKKTKPIADLPPIEESMPSKDRFELGYDNIMYQLDQMQNKLNRIEGALDRMLNKRNQH